MLKATCVYAKEAGLNIEQIENWKSSVIADNNIYYWIARNI